jgi:hypothetical protein
MGRGRTMPAASRQERTTPLRAGPTRLPLDQLAVQQHVPNGSFGRFQPIEHHAYRRGPDLLTRLMQRLSGTGRKLAYFTSSSRMRMRRAC